MALAVHRLALERLEEALQRIVVIGAAQRLFGAGLSPMTVGMSCKSLEVQTPGNRQLGYPAGVFLQVILFFHLDKRDARNRSTSYDLDGV